ncbi:MAG TPA: hypothetical protein VKV95_16520 [Terriglobia bacterium]|nr:hypothetical protein [Terriglobia bacterium]
MRSKCVWNSTLIFTLIISAICNAAQKKSAAEPPDPQRALGCIRTINTSALTYKDTYKKGYSPTLAAMGVRAGVTDHPPEAAGLIDEHLASGNMAGYKFIYMAGKKIADGSIATYTAMARPSQWKEGVVSYFTDESGVIRWTTSNRAPTVKDPTIDSLPELK